MNKKKDLEKELKEWFVAYDHDINNHTSYEVKVELLITVMRQICIMKLELEEEEDNEAFFEKWTAEYSKRLLEFLIKK